MNINKEITIELLQIEHSNELFKLVDENRTYLRKWMPWLDLNKTIKDTENFIKSTIDQYESGCGPHYALFYKNVICGINGFHKIDKLHKIGEIGYWIAESYTGNGIIAITTRKLINIGFTEYNLNKIEIRCAIKNYKSRAIPEKLGFTFDATLRQNECLYGKFVDQAIYSKLASEYKA